MIVPTCDVQETAFWGFSETNGCFVSNSQLMQCFTYLSAPWILFFSCAMIFPDCMRLQWCLLHCFVDYWSWYCHIVWRLFLMFNVHEMVSFIKTFAFLSSLEGNEILISCAWSNKMFSGSELYFGISETKGGHIFLVPNTCVSEGCWQCQLLFIK